MSALSVTLADPFSEASSLLIQHLSQDLGQRYNDDGSGNFKPSDAQGPGGAFVIAWIDNQPVGCGALRPLEPGVGEVKRMYVEPAFRRRGVARKILEKLEAVAREKNYRLLRLETGTLQPEAISLYEVCGYQRIPYYLGPDPHPLSICYEKQL
jgi:GNAT superfamily N-acetyltransferase